MKRHLALVVCALAAWGIPVAAHATQLCEDVQVGVQRFQNGAGAVVGETPIYEQQCTWVAGAIAFDPRTRAFSSAWNNPSADAALATAVNTCGAQCVGFSFFEDFAWVAFAEDDSAYGYSSASAQDAVARCQASTRSAGCETVIGGSSTAAAVYWFYGALAYDAASGRSGKSTTRLRRSEAMAEASQACGTPNCWAYGFQSGYGAIAKSADGRLFGAWSDRKGLLTNAARDAKKACKQQTSDSKCQIVLEGSAVMGLDDIKRSSQDAQEQLERTLKEIGKSY